MCIWSKICFVGVLAFYNGRSKKRGEKCTHSFLKFSFFHRGILTLFYRNTIAEAKDRCLIYFEVPLTT